MGSYVAGTHLFLGELTAMAAAGEHRLTDLARRVITRGGRVHSYQIHDPDEVQGINTPDELSLAQDIVLKRLFGPEKNTDTAIVFGTGGWRAVIGEGYTLANLRRLCQAHRERGHPTGLDSQHGHRGRRGPALPVTGLGGSRRRSVRRQQHPGRCCSPTTCPPPWSRSPPPTWAPPTA